MDEMIHKYGFTTPKEVEDHHLERVHKEGEAIESYGKRFNDHAESEGKKLKEHAVKLL